MELTPEVIKVAAISASAAGGLCATIIGYFVKRLISGLETQIKDLKEWLKESTRAEQECRVETTSRLTRLETKVLNGQGS